MALCSGSRPTTHACKTICVNFQPLCVCRCIRDHQLRRRSVGKVWNKKIGRHSPHIHVIQHKRTVSTLDCKGRCGWIYPATLPRVATSLQHERFTSLGLAQQNILLSGRNTRIQSAFFGHAQSQRVCHLLECCVVSRARMFVPSAINA